MIRAQRPEPRVTPADLHRKVKNLNSRHNLDPGQPGFITLKTWRKDHGNVYRAFVAASIGEIYVSPWMKASDMIECLRHKDWRQVLIKARAEPRWPGDQL